MCAAVLYNRNRRWVPHSRNQHHARGVDPQQDMGNPMDYPND
jgi:hypothetical protein